MHAPLVKKTIPEIRKYVVNFALQRGKETPYDSMTEIYWDDIETIIKAAKSEGFQKLIVPDEENFVDRESAIVFLTEEYPQK